MAKQIIRELIVWIVSIIIAWVIWFPIHQVIPYRFLPLGMLSFVLVLQAARWFVFYDQVVIFKHTYMRLFILCALFLVGFIIWSEGQKIVALAENMELKDLMPENATPVFLSYEQTYNLFNYLRNLLIISNFGTPGIAALLMLKIMYRSLGMGKSK